MISIGDLGSGSDYTPFIQHLGVPSTDIGSDGPYGVYHSAFDNYNWFIKFADPTFVYDSRWLASSGLKFCTWQAPMFCRTTMSPMGRNPVLHRRGQEARARRRVGRPGFR